MPSHLHSNEIKFNIGFIAIWGFSLFQKYLLELAKIQRKKLL